MNRRITAARSLAIQGFLNVILLHVVLAGMPASRWTIPAFAGAWATMAVLELLEDGDVKPFLASLGGLVARLLGYAWVLVLAIFAVAGFFLEPTPLEDKLALLGVVAVLAAITGGAMYAIAGRRQG